MYLCLSSVLVCLSLFTEIHIFVIKPYNKMLVKYNHNHQLLLIAVALKWQLGNAHVPTESQQGKSRWLYFINVLLKHVGFRKQSTQLQRTNVGTRIVKYWLHSDANDSFENSIVCAQLRGWNNYGVEILGIGWARTSQFEATSSA